MHEEEIDNNPEERFLAHQGIELEFPKEESVPNTIRQVEIPVEFQDSEANLQPEKNDQRPV